MKEADYLTLPPFVDTTVDCDMREALQQYKDFEKDLILSMPDEEEISVTTAAALRMKLRQFANGAIYTEDKKYQVIHNYKLDRLVEDVDCLNGNPVLIFYQFQHDLERLLPALKPYKARKLLGSSDINEWNEGKVPVLLAHPMSAGHGLNLQYGGHNMAWFGQDYNLETNMQAVARIKRQGQNRTVYNRKYMSVGTIDYLIEDILQGKKAPQEALMNYIKALVKEHKG